MNTQKSMGQFQRLVETCHKDLPQELRSYLNKRFISDDVIDRFKIGYDKKLKAVTIPISDDSGAFRFFRFRRDPRGKEGEPKYWHTKGEGHQLYGLHNLNGFSRDWVVLCEGEFDCMALESMGIPAVTSTGGAGTFNQEWLVHFKNVNRVFICYDRDVAGMKGAEAVSKIIPNSKVVMLPEIDGGGKDITDYFKAGKSKSDFEGLLKDAKTNDELNTLALLEATTLQGQLVNFNPSQEVVGNKLHLTVPIYIRNDSGASREPLKKVFIAVDSGRGVMQFNSETEFLDKTGFYIKQLPRVKNQEIRWTPSHIREFVGGYRPEPFDAFGKVVNVLKKYSELKDECDYWMLAFWIMGTYLFQTFDTYPYLGVSGLQNSGKTKVLDVLAFTAFNAQKVVNISEASLFRDVESLRSTVILDECEGLNNRAKYETLFSLLNSGYSKGTKVSRQEKDVKGEFATRYFEIYSPKVMANISGFDTVLATRMISVTMLRARGDSERGFIRPSENTDDWAELRHELYSFALCYFRDVKGAYSDGEKTRIHKNRSNDLWSPILSVARVVLSNRPQDFERFKSYALEQIERSSQSGLDSIMTTLLVELRDLVMRDDWYHLREIKERVLGKVETEEREKVTAEWIGHRLRNLGLDAKKSRDAQGVKYFLKRSDIIDRLERYSIDAQAEYLR